ncbi:hypothetical protein ACFXPZ_34875, partial [Streptomyces sp. NPDC059101]
MLPTENRLRRREDFATAVRRGRRAGRPLLVVHCRSGVTDPRGAGGGGGGPPPPGGGGAAPGGGGGAAPHRQPRGPRPRA